MKTFRFSGDHTIDFRPQLTKYLTAGATLSGGFAGVRLVSLGNTEASRLYTLDGLVTPLLDSTLAPQQLQQPNTQTREDVA